MAIAKYKVVKEFEYEGSLKKLGEEIITRDSIGETLVEEGKVNIIRHLEPTDAEDLALIEAYRESEKETIDEREAAEEVRDEATQENLQSAPETEESAVAEEATEETVSDETVEESSNVEVDSEATAEDTSEESAG